MFYLILMSFYGIISFGYVYTHPLSFEKDYFCFWSMFIVLTFSIKMFLQEFSKIIRTRYFWQDRVITVDVHFNCRFKSLFLIECELKYKEWIQYLHDNSHKQFRIDSYIIKYCFKFESQIITDKSSNNYCKYIIKSGLSDLKKTPAKYK